MAEDPDIVNLEKKILSGVKSMFADGERVELQSTADLLMARNAMAAKRNRQHSPRAFRLNPNYRSGGLF